MSAASSCQWPQDAGSTYVVMPIRGLATLEHALALVGGHGLVEQVLFGARVVEVVVDHIVPEQPAGDAARLEPGDRVAECVRKSLHVGLVRVPLERWFELELLLDSVQPGGQERGEREVRVRIG